MKPINQPDYLEIPVTFFGPQNMDQKIYRTCNVMIYSVDRITQQLNIESKKDIQPALEKLKVTGGGILTRTYLKKNDAIVQIFVVKSKNYKTPNNCLLLGKFNLIEWKELKPNDSDSILICTLKLAPDQHLIIPVDSSRASELGYFTSHIRWYSPDLESLLLNELRFSEKKLTAKDIAEHISQESIFKQIASAISIHVQADAEKCVNEKIANTEKNIDETLENTEKFVNNRLETDQIERETTIKAKFSNYSKWLTIIFIMQLGIFFGGGYWLLNNESHHTEKTIDTTKKQKEPVLAVVQPKQVHSNKLEDINANIKKQGDNTQRSLDDIKEKLQIEIKVLEKIEKELVSHTSSLSQIRLNMQDDSPQNTKIEAEEKEPDKRQVSQQPKQKTILASPIEPQGINFFEDEFIQLYPKEVKVYTALQLLSNLHSLKQKEKLKEINSPNIWNEFLIKLEPQIKNKDKNIIKNPGFMQGIMLLWANTRRPNEIRKIDEEIIIDKIKKRVNTFNSKFDLCLSEYADLKFLTSIHCQYKPKDSRYYGLECHESGMSFSCEKLKSEPNAFISGLNRLKQRVNQLTTELE